MDPNMLTYWTYAYCADCSQPTIGGRGHVCEEPQQMGTLERVAFEIARLRLIEQRSKAR